MTETNAHEPVQRKLGKVIGKPVGSREISVAATRIS